MDLSRYLQMHSDPWLNRWLPLIRQHIGDAPVLELGCGTGMDTEILVDVAHRVIAVDLSATSISVAKARSPAAEYHCQDFRDSFPSGANDLGVVLASLSLHYLPWDETLKMVERIHGVLRPGGLFLCRLNSTNDHQHGASGHPPIAENYYLVSGKPKRFFNRQVIDQLFAEHWRMISVEEMIIQRYERPKSVWEIVAVRIA